MGKYLDSAGVSILWNKIKNLIKSKVDEGLVDKLGKPEGIATLNSDGKIYGSQLPSIKTVNGSSLFGEGDIAIDLTLYKVVDSLPTEDIDPNKIYLVTDANNVEGNLYDEFVYTDNKWEKLGSYRASVELADYVKDTDALSAAEVEALLTDNEDAPEE